MIVLKVQCQGLMESFQVTAAIAWSTDRVLHILCTAYAFSVSWAIPLKSSCANTIYFILIIL